MTLGTLRYEIAFNGSPLTDPAGWTWTNITPWVQAGWSASRGIERLQVDNKTGEINLPLDNRDGRFDPGNHSSPYWPNVKEYRPVRITQALTVSGVTTTYPVAFGYVERWPVTWTRSTGRYGEANVYAVDGIGFLTGVDGQAALDAEVLADGPSWYYRLSEAADSGSAGDIVDSHNPPLVLRNSKYGPGTASFGTDIGLRGGGTGVAFDSLHAGSDNTGPMTVLRSRPGPGGYTMAPSSGGFTVEMWIRTPTTRPSFVYVPWGQFSDDSNVVMTFYIDSSGSGYFFMGSAPGVFAFSPSTGPICDGGLHHLFCTVSGDYRTVSIVQDGVDLGSYFNATAIDLSRLTTHLVGGQLLQNGNSFNGFKGSVAAVAMYPGVQSAGRAAAHYRAGLQAWSGESNSARFTRILDNAGWPAALRDVQTAMGTAGAYQVAPVGQQLLDTADAEFGRAYAAADGKLTFRSRADLYAQTTPTIVFGDNPDLGEIPYEPGAVVDFDPQGVVNVASGTRPGGASFSVADPNRFYTRSAELSINVGNDAELIDALNYLVQQRSAPMQRLGQITVKATTKSLAVQAQLLQLPPGTRVRFRRRPPQVLIGGVLTTPPVVTVDCFLETQQHSTDLPNGWDQTFEFSPLPRLSYWRLEDPVYGALGSTTRLGF